MKFIVVLALMLSATFGTLVTAENIHNFLPSNHEAVADYISDNLDLFSEKYGETDDTATVSDKSDEGAAEEMQIAEEPFTATAIEYRTMVTLTDGGDATYLDFNDSCGYMLVGDDYNLMEFKTSGDLPWAREQSELYFDKFDGFMIMVEGELTSAAAYFAYIPDEEIEATTGWTGQESERGGWSKIYANNLYLNERYGGNYKLAEYRTLEGYDSYYTQSMFAGYIGGVVGAEPNCVPTAMYNILNYYRTVRGYTNLPAGTVSYNFANDNDAVVYKMYGSTNLGQRPLPTMYYYARQAAYQHGYNAGGLPYGETAEYLKTLNGYLSGYNMTASSPWISSMNTIISNIISKKPTLLIIGDYFTYKALHAVAAVEYRYYEYTKKFWIFKTTYRKPMIGIDDGQSRVVTAQKIRFIDYDGYMKSCGNPVFKAFAISLS